jgi:hypothetical protein
MDDKFMESLYRDPDAKFADDLRGKLNAQPLPHSLRRVAPIPLFAAGVAAAVIVALFAFPSVRVSAQAMLDLFRVRKFAAVQFDAKRLDQLKNMKEDAALQVFDHQKLQEPAPPQYFTTLEPAATAAGLPAARPSYLPFGLVADTVAVEGEAAMRLTVNEPKLAALLQSLGLGDVQVPAGIDGKSIEVHKPRVLIQRFVNGSRHAAFVEAQSPEVQVPAGLDVERLGEIGLRILGLDADEAHRMAVATDWRSTLIVPVPPTASTFRQVTVHGQPALLVTTNAAPEGDHAGRRNGSICLWSEQDRVFGVMGNLPENDLLQMAESVH